MTRLLGFLLIGAATLVLLACGADDDGSADDLPVLEPRQGGMTTSFDTSGTAFARSARNISLAERRAFGEGDAVFEAFFSTDADEPRGGQPLPGLGPRFDAVGCTSCHVADGRAPGPVDDGPLPVGMIAKFSTDDPTLEAIFGSQLQRDAVDGEEEATVVVRFTEESGEYADGTPYSLRRPTYEVTDPAVGPIPDDASLSVRTAPPLIGLGLLELVSVDDLQGLADPGDADGDGISGEMSSVAVPYLDHEVTGRFGWRGSAASVEHQVALALVHDLGITNRWFPSESCQQGHAGCPRSPGPVGVDYDTNGEGQPAAEGVPYELDDRQLFDLTVYTQALAVPAVRDVDDPEVRRGAAVFVSTGCASCHAGPFTTEHGAIEGLSNQVIDPGTDLLLHDMGDGLADRTFDGAPVTSEWRTAPLWGIGLTQVVAGRAGFLHDGRARTIAEAILWHGGEGAASRDRFRELPADDRDALLAYLDAR